MVHYFTRDLDETERLVYISLETRLLPISARTISIYLTLVVMMEARLGVLHKHVIK